MRHTHLTLALLLLARSAAAAPFAYVANSLGPSVSVLDLGTSRVVATVPVAANAFDLALVPDGSTLYVTHLEQGIVSVVDTATNAVVGTIAIPDAEDAGGPQGPNGITVSRSGAEVYVTGLFSVTVIDAGARQRVDAFTVDDHEQLRGLAAGAGGVLYVAADDANYSPTEGGPGLLLVDPAARVPRSGPIPVNAPATLVALPDFPLYEVALSPDGARAYVAQRGDDPGHLYVVDLGSRTLAAEVAVGGEPQHVVVHPDGSRVYVSNASSHTVSVVDTRSNEVTATVPVGPVPLGMAINATGSRLYVTLSSGDAVAVVDTSTNRRIGILRVGRFPSAIVLGPGSGGESFDRLGSAFDTLDALVSALSAAPAAALGGKATKKRLRALIVGARAKVSAARAGRRVAKSLKQAVKLLGAFSKAVERAIQRDHIKPEVGGPLLDGAGAAASDLS
jgi:YVTN family beta-propeller protein